MGLKELVDIFLNIENEYNLFTYRVRDIQIWPIIRMQLWWNYIVKYKLNFDNPNPNLSNIKFYQKCLRLIGLIWGSYKYNPNNIKQYKDILIIGSSRRILYQKYYFDIYTDFIINSLEGYSKLTLTKSRQGIHYNPVATKEIRFVDNLNLKYLLIKNLYKKDKEIFNIIIDMIYLFNKKLKCQIETKVAENLYYDRILNFLIYRDFFYNYLYKINPRIILEITHYNSFSLAVNTVAQYYKIPIVELQHGPINELHIGYNYKNLVYYDDFKFLPNYLFLFGLYWKKNIAIPHNILDLKITGFPYIEHRLINKVKTNKIRNILIISQKVLSKQIFKFSLGLRSKLPMSYKIILKLHPNEYIVDKNMYKRVLNIRNFEIISDNNRDLYELFSISEYQIGVFSTAIFEGIFFDLTTIIINLPGFEYMQELIDNEVVFFVNDSVEASNIIKLNKKPINYLRGKKKFWKSKSIENTIFNIKKILNVK